MGATSTTNNEAMRRISAQPFGLRRQEAVSSVAPGIRPPGARNAVRARL